MAILSLTLVSFAAWFISTLAGGGSPFILIPVINYLFGSQSVAPVLTIGMLLGSVQRSFLFWQDIDWKVTLWFSPSALFGAILGAYVFTKIQLQWLQLLLGLIVAMTVVNNWLGEKKFKFTVQIWQFLPIGFVFAFLSGLIGSTGPALNPFFLNYGLEKEQMIATKSANVVVINVVKIVSYAVFGALTPQYQKYGLIIGLAAIPANWLGQRILSKMNNEQFRKIVFSMMAINSVLMLWQQRNLIALFVLHKLAIVK
jgi:uncharacterized membrane protein YfcA